MLPSLVRLGGSCGLAALLLAAPLATAQEGGSPPSATWQDPPARAKPVTPAAVAEKPVAEAKPKAHKPVREARMPGWERVAGTRAGKSRTRQVEIVRPARVRRVAIAPRGSVTAVRPAYAGPAVVYGMDPRDARLARIRSAQEAGFIVVRSRSVEFPDGRSLRTYRPYESEPEED